MRHELFQRVLLRTTSQECSEIFLLVPSPAEQDVRDAPARAEHVGGGAAAKILGTPSPSLSLADEAESAHLTWTSENGEAVVIKLPFCTRGDVLRFGRGETSPVTGVMRCQNSLAIALSHMLFVTGTEAGGDTGSWARYYCSAVRGAEIRGIFDIRRQHPFKLTFTCLALSWPHRGSVTCPKTRRKAFSFSFPTASNSI